MYLRPMKITNLQPPHLFSSRLIRMQYLRPSLLAILILIWVLLAVILFVFQSHFVYFPSRRLVAFPDQVGLNYQSVYFTTEDGLRLHGWYVPAAQTRAIVLFFHGNAGNISYWLNSLKIFNHLGVDTFIIDYRGYGLSEGRPTESGSYRDALAAWRYLTVERGIPGRRVVLFGQSLGAAIATWLATQVQPAALILESAFTSVRAMAREHYPLWPASLLVWIRYPTIDRIAQVACPVLVAHSRSDEIVPFTHAEHLLKAARAPKAFLELTGGHNDGFLVTGREYIAGLDRFLSKVLQD